MATSEEILERIDMHLRALVALAAATALDGMTQSQKIERLARAGLDARTISEATAIPMTTVSPALSKLRKASASAKS